MRNDEETKDTDISTGYKLSTLNTLRTHPGDKDNLPAGCPTCGQPLTPGRKVLTDAVLACCFGVADRAELQMLARQDLEAGLPLLGHLCDRIAADGPPGPGEETAWCTQEWQRWKQQQALRTRPDPGPLVEDPGEEDELVFPFEADVVDDDPGDPGEVP